MLLATISVLLLTFLHSCFGRCFKNLVLREGDTTIYLPHQYMDKEDKLDKVVCKIVFKGKDMECKSKWKVNMIGFDAPVRDLTVQHSELPPSPPPPPAEPTLPSVSLYPGCGRKPSFTKVVGGAVTERNEWPWQARVTVTTLLGDIICGGVIVSPTCILTAGHCLDWSVSAINVRVIVGAYNLGNFLEAGRQYPVVLSVTRHPAYKVIGVTSKTLEILLPSIFPGVVINDIGVVKLTAPLVFNEFVGSACLPNRGETYEKSLGWTTGWGAVWEGGPTSDHLRGVSVPIVSNTDCRRMLKDLPIRSEMVCAGRITGGKDSCQGDSGGPLMVHGSDGRWAVVGITSFGRGCARPNTPGVYTRVSAYLDWIKSVCSS